MSLAVQPDCLKGRASCGTFYGDVHFKDPLGSIARVGYPIPVSDCYLVLYGLRTHSAWPKTHSNGLIDKSVYRCMVVIFTWFLTSLACDDVLEVCERVRQSFVPDGHCVKRGCDVMGVGKVRLAKEHVRVTVGDIFDRRTVVVKI